MKSYDTDETGLRGKVPVPSNANALDASGTDDTFTVSVTSRSRIATYSCHAPSHGGCRDVGGLGRW